MFELTAFSIAFPRCEILGTITLVSLILVVKRIGLPAFFNTMAFCHDPLEAPVGRERP